MIISVDADFPLPVYEQVRSQIRRLVASGALTAGTQLPTIRQLAADLGLAKGTIERAYELLEGDQVISRQGRRGTFVSMTSDDAAATDTDLRAAAEQFVVVARQLGLGEAAAIKAVRTAWQQ